MFTNAPRRRRQLAAGRPLRLETLETRSLLATCVVNHTPYLQLGDAPLPGLPGNAADRALVMWQTKPDSAAGDDAFAVDFRMQGNAAWTAAPVSTTATGVEGRVVYSAPLTGLAYNADYEYRVTHHRNATALETFQSVFHTRLAAGVNDVFSFAAYGDSAIGNPPTAFIGVQNRVNALDPAFTLLLGDNAYPSGSHANFDARFDPTINAATPAYAAAHVEYATLGNHDVATASGQPSRDNYAPPNVQLGVTSLVAPPVGEAAEANYSWDYGNVHFATFDSNSWNTPDRLARQLTWLTADLAASHARWKIVYMHHPLASLVDHTEMTPSTNYCTTVLPALRAAGVDLLLTGHAHDYQRSYPLLASSGGALQYVRDVDGQYAKGAGVVQIISGVGGGSVRPAAVAIPAESYNARSMTSDTVPAARFGLVRVSVSVRALTVAYVAANDGSVLDSVTIVDEALPIAGDRPGLYDPAAALFHLRNSLTTGVADAVFGFGPPGAGWTPLVGDWNGDGADSVGLYDPQTLVFYLRNTNATGMADAVFGFGDPAQREQYAPLVGDWDGDGVDTVGLYHKASSSWWLCNTPRGAFADVVFGFGPPAAGWQPRVGDWNGDGVDSIGLFDPANGLLFVRNANTIGFADSVSAVAGAHAGVQTVMGDWNSDRTPSAGSYEPSTGLWRLRNANASPAPDVIFGFGPAGSTWLPLAGKWVAATAPPAAPTPPLAAAAGAADRAAGLTEEAERNIDAPLAVDLLRDGPGSSAAPPLM